MVNRNLEIARNSPANLERKVEEDIWLLRQAFLPGLKVDNRIVLFNLVNIFLAGLWCWFFTKYIYLTDRSDFDRFNQDQHDVTFPPSNSPRGTAPDIDTKGRVLDSPAMASTRAPSSALPSPSSDADPPPELMLVFHHPGHDYKDSDEELSSSIFDHILSHNVIGEDIVTDSLFENILREQGKFGESPEGLLEKMHSLSAGMQRSISKRFTACAESTLPTKKSTRIALLQDLYKLLPEMGFDISCYSSVDGDELFVEVRLGKPEMLDHYLRRIQTELQLRNHVGGKLGIKQPRDELASSPPFVEYNPQIVGQLHKAGLLGPGDLPDERRVFKLFYDKYPECGSIVSGSNLIRIMFRELSEYIDLDAAKAEGLLVDWYPVHSATFLKPFKVRFGRLRMMADLTFVQPLQSIKEYFGERLAFNFGWNGFYCKLLLSLVPLALFFEFTQKLVREMAFCGFDREWRDNRQVLFPCIVILCWARLSTNLWDREQAWYLNLWGSEDPALSLIVRPQFKGQLKPSRIDANLKELEYSPSMHVARKFVAALAK